MAISVTDPNLNAIITFKNNNLGCYYGSNGGALISSGQTLNVNVNARSGIICFARPEQRELVGGNSKR